MSNKRNSGIKSNKKFHQKLQQSSIQFSSNMRPMSELSMNVRTQQNLQKYEDKNFQDYFKACVQPKKLTKSGMKKKKKASSTSKVNHEKDLQLKLIAANARIQELQSQLRTAQLKLRQLKDTKSSDVQQTTSSVCNTGATYGTSGATSNTVTTTKQTVTSTTGATTNTNETSGTQGTSGNSVTRYTSGTTCGTSWKGVSYGTSGATYGTSGTGGAFVSGTTGGLSAVYSNTLVKPLVDSKGGNSSSSAKYFFSSSGLSSSGTAGISGSQGYTQYYTKK